MKWLLIFALLVLPCEVAHSEIPTVIPSLAEIQEEAQKREDLCESIVRMRENVLLDNSIEWNQERHINELPVQNTTFMIPTLCDLLHVRNFLMNSSTALGPSWWNHEAGKKLTQYSPVAVPRLADVCVDPQLTSPRIEDPVKLEDRRKRAFDILIEVATRDALPVNRSLFVRKQAQLYKSYAQRMQLLAPRVEGEAVPVFPVPALDDRPNYKRIRRACEILIALEDAKDKPPTPAEEAKLVRELGTLRQGFSAPTLVEYLAKPVEGLDKAEVKGALLAIGEEAVPEVLRFLRADGRSPESLQEALPLLVALCKSPEAAKARLLETARIDEEGAKRFEEQATRMAQ